MSDPRTNPDWPPKTEDDCLADARAYILSHAEDSGQDEPGGGA